MKKQFILLFLLLSYAGFTFGQNELSFEVTNDADGTVVTNEATFTATSDEKELALNIKNISSTGGTFTAKLLDMKADNDVEIKVCASSCKIWKLNQDNQDEGNTNPIAVGDVTHFHFENKKGKNFALKIAIFDDDNPRDKLIFNYVRGHVSGVNDKISSESFVLYPNPVHDLLTIRVPENLAGTKKLTINNIHGKQIKEVISSDNKNDWSINVASFSEGMYFCTFSDDKGNKITKRFVISK